MARPLQLHVDVAQQGARAALSRLRCIKVARRMLAAAAPRIHSLELSVAFLSAEKSRTVNLALRGKKEPADVISLALHSAVGGVLVGQIFLCPKLIAERAKETERAPKDEAAALYLHGLLHVLGYSHQRSAAARAMERLERRILLL